MSRDELTPPYSLVYEIRLEDGHYQGYDESGQHVIELTDDGATDLVIHHGVHPVGFMAGMPTLRTLATAFSAFGAGMSSVGYSLGGMNGRFKETTDILKEIAPPMRKTKR